MGDRQLQLHRMMTKYLLLALFLGVAMAAEYDDSALMDNGEGRFLYLNSSSTATSLTLLGAVILLGVIFYLVYAGGLLSPAASSYSRYGQDYNQYYQGYQGQARSSNEGWGFNPMAVLQWISMLQDVYEKFEYMDASERSLGQKQCEEFFQCPYSLKDAVKRNFSGNSLILCWKKSKKIFGSKNKTFP